MHSFRYRRHPHHRHPTARPSHAREGVGQPPKRRRVGGGLDTLLASRFTHQQQWAMFQPRREREGERKTARRPFVIVRRQPSPTAHAAQDVPACSAGLASSLSAPPSPALPGSPQPKSSQREGVSRQLSCRPDRDRKIKVVSRASVRRLLERAQASETVSMPTSS